MSVHTALFTADEQHSLQTAATVALELLPTAGSPQDARLVQAVAGCRPTADALARALPVLTALRDRCARESDPGFWIAEIAAMASEVADQSSLVQSLIDARHAQAHVVGEALAACVRVLALQARPA